MKLVKIPASEWAKYSADAHRIVFDEVRLPKLDRIDFALVIEDEGIPQTYMTIRETDSETAYMQYGGAFPSAKGTPKSLAGYLMSLDYLSKHYKYANTLIENTNTPMLKFALKGGLKIIGLRNFKGHVLLEHIVEWSS